MLEHLPPGWRRGPRALIGGEKARAYREAEELLGVSVGTVYEPLRRVRARHPEVYGLLMASRRGQLDRRHREAVARAEERSRRYHRRKAAYRHHEQFGVWPWERGR